MAADYPYRITYERAALRDLKNLTIDVVVQVVGDIAELKHDQFPSNSEPLVGENAIRRLRSGDFRAIYSIEHDQRVVSITRVRHRKDVYRH